MNASIAMPIALTGGVVYLRMALTIARMLRGNPLVKAVRLWAVGALCFGMALLLVAGRNHLNALLPGGKAVQVQLQVQLQVAEQHTQPQGLQATLVPPLPLPLPTA